MQPGDVVIMRRPYTNSCSAQQRGAAAAAGRRNIKKGGAAGCSRLQHCSQNVSGLHLHHSRLATASGSGSSGGASWRAALRCEGKQRRVVEDGRVRVPVACSLSTS